MSCVKRRKSMRSMSSIRSIRIIIRSMRSMRSTRSMWIKRSMRSIRIISLAWGPRRKKKVISQVAQAWPIQQCTHKSAVHCTLNIVQCTDNCPVQLLLHYTVHRTADRTIHCSH